MSRYRCNCGQEFHEPFERIAHVASCFDFKRDEAALKDAGDSYDGGDPEYMARRNCRLSAFKEGAEWARKFLQRRNAKPMEEKDYAIHMICGYVRGNGGVENLTCGVKNMFKTQKTRNWDLVSCPQCYIQKPRPKARY